MPHAPGSTMAALRTSGILPLPDAPRRRIFRSHMRPLESAVGSTRRNIRIFLAVGGLLAVVSCGIGGLLFYLGRPQPDVTLTFAEFGLYVAGLGVLNLLCYAGLFWQISRLSRRPRPLPAEPPKGLE